jgi:hypothetical protein
LMICSSLHRFFVLRSATYSIKLKSHRRSASGFG